MSLWAYALGTGAANKFNQIVDEKRRLEGNIELEKQKAIFDNTEDPLANKFSIKGTDVMFNLPAKEDLTGQTADRKRMLWMDAYYQGALEFDKDQWDAAIASNKQGYQEFKHKFLNEAKLFWKRYGQTEKGGNIYREFDYSGLKELLPDTWRDLELLNPGSKPKETLESGITDAFNVDDEASIVNDMVPSDVIQVPYNFDTKNYEANSENFDKFYGKDFGKEVVMNAQYAGLNEDDYNAAKGEAPWKILIPTYQWMSDNSKISHEQANKEIAQMQINYGLSDSELIDYLAFGTKKHSIKSEGGFTTRKMVNQVQTTEFGRAQNASAVVPEIIENIERLQRYIASNDSKTGFVGWLNRFYNSTYGDKQGSMINQFGELVNTIRSADADTMFEANGSGILGNKGGLFNGEEYGTTSEEVRANIINKINETKLASEELFRQAQSIGLDITDVNDMDTEVGGLGTIRQSMIETLAIGLAFQIAMVEQGSGGKAVSDQDFDRAYQRVKGTWYSSEGDVIATLNEERFKMSKSLMRNTALSHSKEYGSGTLKWYDRIVDGRVKVLNEYKNAFNTNGMLPLEERTQRLINMYTETGGDRIQTYGYGDAPDVLTEAGMQTLLSNFTKDEAAVLGIKLSDMKTLNEKSNSNRKVIIDSKGNKIENKTLVTKKEGSGQMVQSSFAPDLVNKYLESGTSQGDTNIATVIDRVIKEIQDDTERVFFKNKEENVTYGDLKDEDAMQELRMKILRQWMEAYQTNYDPSNPLFMNTRNQIGMYGNNVIPENQSKAVHDKLWSNQ